eukprot:15942468-Heterocapsa_arctica.AAC.1
MAVAWQMMLDERRGLAILLWISLPCTPWTTWQYVNATLGPKTFNRILEERQGSMEMIRLLVTAVRVLLVQLHRSHFICAFERPREAIGWKLKELKPCSRQCR